MPIYEYACAGCDSEFELEQRITEDPIKTCPRCRSRKVKRLISQTSFVLKGGGWYADLYASKRGASKADEGGGDAAVKPASETPSDTSSGDSAKPSAKKGEKGAKAAAA
jgi:putative FmdB family regulatory protein